MNIVSSSKWVYAGCWNGSGADRAEFLIDLFASANFITS